MAGGTTILVKKADGTSVRMSLDEIKKMKEAKTVEVKEPVVMPQKPEAVTSPSAQNDEALLRHSERSEESLGSAKLNVGSLLHRFATAHAVDSVRRNTPHSTQDDSLPSRPSPSVIPSEAERSDAKSRDPLAVKKTISKSPIQARTSSDVSNYDEIVKKIIKDSGVNISPELSSRSVSLVTSRLKGIRDDDQFLAYAQKSGGDGGLSLNQSQAERILKFITDYLKINNVKITKPSSMPMLKQSLRRPAGMLPLKNTFSHELSNTTPVTDIFLDEAKAKSQKINAPSASPVPTVSSAKSAIKEIIKLPADYDFIHRMTAKNPPKKGELIQDIKEEQKPIEEKFTGPADEMKKFNLRDWRRLAHKPGDCAEIIFHKFTGWKEESFLLYMSCKQAWSQSPLLTEYRNILLQSINTGTTVQNIIKNLHSKDSLLYEEFLELGRLNAKLEM